MKTDLPQEERRGKRGERRRLLPLCALLSSLCLSALAQTPIRISGDSAVRYAPVVTDSNTQISIQWVRGDYVRIEVGLFDKGVFVSNNISRYTNIALMVFSEQNDTNAPFMAEAITNGSNGWNANCSLAAWTSNLPPFTNYNVEFNFNDSQTAINLNQQASQSYWMRIFATSTDSPPHTVTYLETPVTIYDGPITPYYSPPAFSGFLYVDNCGNLVNPLNFFLENAAQIGDALIESGFMPNPSPGTNVIMTNGVVTLSNGSNQVLTPFAYPVSVYALSYLSRDGTWSLPFVSNIVAGRSFTLCSANPADTNSVYWGINSPYLINVGLTNGVTNLTSGVAVIPTPLAYSSNVITLAYESLDGSCSPIYVAAYNPGVSFTVDSANVADTNTICWSITTP